jgi:hypothetical protein
MNAQGMIQLQASKRPEDVERRHRNYMEAREPLVKAMTRIYALATPSYCFIMHSDGTSTNLSQRDDGLTPEMRQQMEWLKAQDAALARSYGFEVKEPSDE